MGAGSRRVVVISNDTIGAAMAGPGIRCYEMSRVLGRRHDVTLAAPAGPGGLSTGGSPGGQSATDEPFVVRTYRIGDAAGLEVIVDGADVIVMQGYILHFFPGLAQTPAALVVDIYDPFTLENLEVHSAKPIAERREFHWMDHQVLNDQLRAGDFFLCASEKQRDYWLGMLAAMNRVNPDTYDADVTLRRLIDVAPFGLPSEPPARRRASLKGVVPGIAPDDFVLLWGGGIYNWFDPVSLIRAVGEVARERPDVKLFMMGVKHPSPHVPEMEMSRRAQQEAERLGLLGTQVIFNYGWVPYAERADFLLESDVGVSTHLEHVETEFSFRTRILDYMWAGLPVLCSRGDSVGGLVEERGLGLTVAPEDVSGLVEAILTLAGDDEMRESCRRAARATAVEYTWERVMEPLSRFCDSPVKARDRGRYDDIADRLAARGPSPVPRSLPRRAAGYVKRRARGLIDRG